MNYGLTAGEFLRGGEKKKCRPWKNKNESKIRNKNANKKMKQCEKERAEKKKRKKIIRLKIRTE